MIDDIKLYRDKIVYFLDMAAKTVTPGDKPSLKKALKYVRQADTLLGVIGQTIYDEIDASPEPVKKKH